ncbi:MAG: hypothetical protein ACI8RD_009374 [Bacillariaceae sp.]|jgi:hypothetical protein
MAFFRQMLRAGFQSATILPVGDAIAQTMIEGRSLNFNLFENNDNDNDNSNGNQFDVGRTLRWSATGLLLQGPYFFAGYSAVDKIFGATKKSWMVVAKKTITVQSLLFPPYLVLFFGFMGQMENHPNVEKKIENGVSKAFVPGCMFWPVANTINFAMIPPTYRVPYSAVAGIFWSSYLSYANAKLCTNTTATATATTTKKCIASSSSEIIVPTMKE